MLMLPIRDKQTTTREDRATQLLICATLSFAIYKKSFLNKLWTERKIIFSQNERGSSMKALQVEANKGLLSLEELPRPEVTIITSLGQKKKNLDFSLALRRVVANRSWEPPKKISNL